ncbi:MAG: hypothetical protein RL758_1505 [Pseudomonadota bacterium]|jgi:two-component system response regulator PilR (NtrC family)
METGHILVVDDEPDLLTLYELALLREGHQVVTASTIGSARHALEQGEYDLVVTDMRLPDGLGLDLLSDLVKQRRKERCVVITAYGSADNAVQALKAGAFDYLTKPVDLVRFRAVVRDAVRSSAASPVFLDSSLATLPQVRASGSRQMDKGERALARLCGDSTPMKEVRAKVRKVASSMAPVLLQGESGTGKELVARAVHDCSHRADQPFVAVNCGAIPETLLEAEFFGVKKGAYTGAQQDRDGFFQAASGGTLFLDEIGDLPLIMQSKLLRAIQERCVRPIGSTTEIPVDVRIVSASHKRLSDEVDMGRFRKDLYYRINVIELFLPPLRQRKQDLPQLAGVLIDRIAQSARLSPVPTLSSRAHEMLQHHDFPGNVRELENILHRALALHEGDELELDYSFALAASSGAESVQAAPAFTGATGETANGDVDIYIPEDLSDYLDQQEKAILLKVLNETEFNRTAAAQRLGISLRQIRYRMERLNIAPPGSRIGNEAHD